IWSYSTLLALRCASIDRIEKSSVFRAHGTAGTGSGCASACLPDEKSKGVLAPDPVATPARHLQGRLQESDHLVGATDYHRRFGRLARRRSTAGAILCLCCDPLVRMQQFRPGNCQRIADLSPRTTGRVKPLELPDQQIYLDGRL